MATYPQGNPGVAPPDFTTDVGKVRALVGDTVYEEYDPPEAGFGNYVNFSDAEIEAFLAAGGDDPLRAAGWAYLQFAATAALESVSASDYDLRVDLTKRSADLRAIAQLYFDQADEADAGSEDAFLIVPTGEQCLRWPPEAAPWDLSQFPWRRC